MTLDPLLAPRSIAVIGASDNKARIGGVPIDLLKRAGFQRLYPVNPKTATVQGLPAFADIEAVPEVVDLAISPDAVLPCWNAATRAAFPPRSSMPPAMPRPARPTAQRGRRRWQAIAGLGQAVLAGPDALREVEVNPLLVMPAGQGAVALDALVLLDREAER
jgi:acetate---CoA ligase (ADP-forming)